MFQLYFKTCDVFLYMCFCLTDWWALRSPFNFVGSIILPFLSSSFAKCFSVCFVLCNILLVLFYCFFRFIGLQKFWGYNFCRALWMDWLTFCISMNVGNDTSILNCVLSLCEIRNSFTNNNLSTKMYLMKNKMNKKLT